MADYISREAVINITAETGAWETQNRIRELPSADVQPVKRGEWDFRGYQLFKCTNCKEIFTQNQLEAMQNHIDREEFTFPNFCPNCEADMRGDTNG